MVDDFSSLDFASLASVLVFLISLLLTTFSVGPFFLYGIFGLLCVKMQLQALRPALVLSSSDDRYFI